MALDKTFNKLKLNLLRPFIFYVPKNLIPEDKKELWKEEKYQVYFNNVIIIDHKGWNYELKESPSFYEILYKQTYLDDNMFILLDKREKLKTYQFQVLLDKYLQQLNFYVYVAEWMQNNLFMYIEGASDEIKNSFRLQYDTFQKHSDQIHSDVSTNSKEVTKTNMDVLEFVEDNVSDLKEILSGNEKLKLEKVGSNIQEEIKLRKAEKKQSAILTNKEADDFLLKTVFKVKLDKNEDNE
jgi:hypothetical protein